MSASPDNTDYEFEEKKKIRSARILIVDDEIDLLESLAEILRQDDYEVKSASSGKAAIEFCQNESFDIALIDIKLPDMKGTILLNELNIWAPKTSKIMITGFPSLETAIESLNSGANGYLLKPFKPDQLLELIKEQLIKNQQTELGNLLINLGLSSYEAKIYLSLANEKSSEVRKIGMLSGVPRTKVYSSLRKLVQRGLIAEIPGKTQKFSVTPPSTSFKSIIRSQKKELSEQAASLVKLEKTVSLLDSKVEERGRLAAIKKSEVWSFEGNTEIMVLISDLLSNAENSVIISTTETGFVLFLKKQRKILDHLVSKNVKVQLTVPEVFSNQKLQTELKSNYKITKRIFECGLFFLYIDKNIFLLTNAYTTTSLLEKSSAIVIRDSGAAFLANLFNISEQA